MIAPGSEAPRLARTSARDSVSPAENRVFRRGREAAALTLVASAIFLTLALASFNHDPAVPEVVGANWVGPAGAFFANAIVSTIGVIAWTIPVELVLISLPLFRNRPSMASVARIGGDSIVILVLSALIHVSFPMSTAFGALPVGGSIGELFGELMRSLFSTAGSYLIGVTVVLLVLIARASFSFISFAQRAGETTGNAAAKGASGMRALKDAWQRARAIERRRAHGQTSIPISGPGEDEAIFATIDADVVAASEEAKERAAAQAAVVLDAVHQDLTPSPLGDNDGGIILGALDSMGEHTPLPTPRADHLAEPPGTASDTALEDQNSESAPSVPDETDEEGMDLATIEEEATPSEAPKPVRKRRPRKPAGPKIVDTSAEAEVEKVQGAASAPVSPTGYRMPPFDLMDLGDDPAVVIDEELQEHLNENAQLLITTLSHYGVRGEIREIQPGPTVTTYEMEPEAGTKVSKIAGLADDLAMSLGCQVRIIAPIPGKKRVGFEVPNRVRKTVNLRELIEDRKFQEMKAPLPVVLGRDIVGKPFYGDLASMPHVLVAGATGAGKSVGLNVMLVSMLCRRSPEEMRLLMVDPKVVELQSFDRIPHMLLPVVTDTRQAANALKWAVDEMERRYQLLANAGTKNIKTYNGWVERVHRGEVRGYEKPKPAVVTSEDGSIVEFGVEKEAPKLPDKLPYIVIVIDEFADLMMQQGKEVEASIARLAQKARAAGMHVILATQRPSVDVITGMIKANFPSRIAFKVTQRNDSRTILDEQGAEHLLGRGDMLVKLNGSNETRRVQCPFVSEEEVERVTSFLRQQGEPEYDDSILQPRDDDGESGVEDAEQDVKYDEAVQIVAETRRCSTSWLQRKLGIGYNRAAKIVEMMEKRGLVGAAQGAKDREVLIDPL
jgi:DNA segregation ATPase FtsK/SpoIIIE, S-DNA-T family